MAEDDEGIRTGLCELLQQTQYDGRAVSAIPCPEIHRAPDLVREHHADLLVIDIYQGSPRYGGQPLGNSAIQAIQERRFLPIIVYSALPDRVERPAGPFLVTIPKEEKLPVVLASISKMFERRIPQVHRALIGHTEFSLRGYMWGFVSENWSDFEQLTTSRDFFSLLIRRLALTLESSSASDAVTEYLGPNQLPPPSGSSVHGTSWWIKPPMHSEPVLGDLRRRRTTGAGEYWIAVQPTCDSIDHPNRHPVSAVICVKASRFETTSQFHEFSQSHSKGSFEKLRSLITNHAAERFHFLPGAWTIPDLVVDFQTVFAFPLAEMNSMERIGTLDSPYAEALSNRFAKYFGRIGTPDLDVDAALQRMGIHPP